MAPFYCRRAWESSILVPMSGVAIMNRFCDKSDVRRAPGTHHCGCDFGMFEALHGGRPG